MIVEYIRYQTDPDRGRMIIDAYRAASGYLRDAPECLSQEVAVCTEDAGAVTVRLQWISVEDHMQGFRKGPHFPSVLALVRPFIGDIAEMRHYTALALE